MEDTRALIAALPLKEMDATLLRSAVLDIARREGWDMELISRALDIAAYGHRNQHRSSRGKMPVVHYIEHPYRVSLRYLRYNGRSQDGAIAAILHDTVEDCAKDLALALLGKDVPVAEARALIFDMYEYIFGTVVSRTVYKLSNPLPTHKLTREESNDEYVDHVLEAIVDALVFIIKFADFADNALSLHHMIGGTGAAKVQRMATKYLRLVEPFYARLDDEDVLALVGAEGVAMMRKHLDANRLAEFAAYVAPAGRPSAAADTIARLTKTVKRLEKKAAKANARADENATLHDRATSRIVFLGNAIRPATTWLTGTSAHAGEFAGSRVEHALTWLTNAIEHVAGLPKVERDSGFHHADVKKELVRLRVDELAKAAEFEARNAEALESLWPAK